MRAIAKLTELWPWSGRRRELRLGQMRSELAGRGIPVAHLTDAELEQLISEGRQVLDAAHVRGSDATGAFVVAVRKQQKF